jgi:competence ComEA-like helix-hairpin-helix protein
MTPAASTEQEGSALSSAPFPPAEVDSRGDEGGGRAAPATRPSWFRRSREAFQGSVWAPVALKVAGLVLGMLVLSGVGIASILSGTAGVQVPLASLLGSDVHAAWLASKPAASARGATIAASTANAPAAAPSSTPTAAPQSDAKSSPPARTDSASPAASAGMTQDGKVILNLATLEDLRHLPGVGQKRADAILALRARLGHFKHVNDLLRVKGIGVRGLKKILPHVLLDPPQTPAA